MMSKIDRTKQYDFVGDLYEYYGQDRSSKDRTHSDVGWRLRSKKYGRIATFAKLDLKYNSKAYFLVVSKYTLFYP